MPKTISIFNNQVADGDSIEFEIDQKNSKSFSDTENSAYFKIYGNLDGGTLLLKCKAQHDNGSSDNGYYELEEDNSKIATYFPSDESKILITPLNYKDTETFKFTLSGSGGNVSLYIDGINMKEV